MYKQQNNIYFVSASQEILHSKDLRLFIYIGATRVQWL